MSGSTATTSGKKSRSAVKVPVSLPRLGEGEKTEMYWLGIVPECPMDYITAGGACFQKYRGKLIDDNGAMLPIAELQKGVNVPLEAEQVEFIKTCVQIRVVRPRGRIDNVAGTEDVPEFGTAGKGRSATIVLMDSKKYRRQSGDVPLAKFLYMHRLADLSMEDASRFPPETMAEG